MSSLSTKEEVRQIHIEVLSRTNELIENLKATNKQNDETVKKEVESLISSIENDNKKLKNLIDELERDGEFEKFSIAFFGQTNAGKSTIIEALRILFNEENRAKTISDNNEKQQKWQEEHVEHCRKVLIELEDLKKVYSPNRHWKRWTFWLLAAFFTGLMLGKFIAL